MSPKTLGNLDLDPAYFSNFISSLSLSYIHHAPATLFVFFKHPKFVLPSFPGGTKNESVSCSVVSDFLTSGTIACQAPLSTGFSWQEHWSELPFPSPRDLPDSGIEHRSSVLQAVFLQSELSGKLVVKNSTDNTGDIIDTSSIPGSGRSPGGGHNNPLQYSCLENPMVRGPGRLQSRESQRVGHDWSDLAHSITCNSQDMEAT